MPEFTDNFKLTRLDPGDDISANGYAFIGDNISKIDRLLAIARNHTHTGAGGTLVDPDVAPVLDLTSGTGALPAGTTVRYRYTYVDEYGAETAGSPEATVATPDPIQPPGAPDLSYLATGGTLVGGLYYYALTAYTTTSTQETTLGDALSVSVSLSTTTNQIVVDLPVLPANADGFNIYIRRPNAARYEFLDSVDMTVATPPTQYVDDGSVAPLNSRQPPNRNLTFSSNTVEVTLPGATPTVPAGSTWKIYRTFDENNWSASFLHHVLEETFTGSGVITPTFTDVGDGTLVQSIPEVSEVATQPGKIGSDELEEAAAFPNYTTVGRPAASSVPAGTSIFNTTTGAPEWSNGSVWVSTGGGPPGGLSLDWKIATDYGVAGDGVTDDAAAIETLLETAGYIYFPAGTYKINSQISWTQTAPTDVWCHPDAVFAPTSGAGFNTSAVGLGNGHLILHQTSGSNAEYMRWRGGQLDGHLLPAPVAGNVWPIDANAQVEWPPPTGNGVSAVGSPFYSANAVLREMVIEDLIVWNDNPAAAGDWHWTNAGGDQSVFVDVENISDFQFRRNKCFASRGAALYIAAVGSGSGSTRIDISDNYFHGCGAGGVHVKGHIVGGTVHNNTFWNCAQPMGAINGNDGSSVGVSWHDNIINGYWRGFVNGSTPGISVLRDNVWANAGHFDSSGVSMSDSGGPLDDFFDTPVLYWIGDGAGTVNVRDDIVLNGAADGTNYHAIGTWGGGKPWFAYFGNSSGNRIHNVRVPTGAVFDRLANEFGTSSNNIISWDDGSLMDHTLTWTGPQAATSRAHNSTGSLRWKVATDYGVVGDGVTDNSAAIKALLDAGGYIYFPSGTYFCASGMNIVAVGNLEVQCAVDAVFKGGASVITDLFEFKTSSFVTLRFKWTGGIIDGGLMPNSTSSAAHVVMGLYNQPTLTSATNDLFSFRDAFWGSIEIIGTTFTSRENSHILQRTDHANQHWMGNPTTNTPNGADSHIFANCGPGTLTIRDTVHMGSRDSAIYLAGVGFQGGPSLTTIDGVKVYWSTSAISVKSTITQVNISNCLAYGCATGFEAEDTGSNPGSDAITYSNCTTRRTHTGFEILDSTRVRYVDCASYDLGFVDWQGKADTTDGYVQITSASAGSAVTGITVNGVQLMSGTVNYSTNVETLAKAVASNINAHCLAQGLNFRANANNLYTGIWRVFITGFNGAGVSPSNVVAVTTSGTITTVTDNMAFAFTTPKAFNLGGGTGTVIDGLYVDGIDTAWATDRAASPDVRAVFLRSGTDIDSVDTTVRNLYADNITSLGGEVTNLLANADIDRTHFDGVRTGTSLTNFAAPTLIGASSSFTSGLNITKILSSNHVVNNQVLTTVGTGQIPPGFTIPVLAGRWYRISMELAWQAVSDTTDVRVAFIAPASSEGFWTINAAGTGATTNNSGITIVHRNWTETQGAGTLSAHELVYVAHGMIRPTVSGNLSFEWAQNGNPAGTPVAENVTLLAGSTFGLEWVG